MQVVVAEDATAGLPYECLATVFSFLDCVTRSARAGRVCRRWHAIASDDRAVLSVVRHRTQACGMSRLVCGRSCARVPRASLALHSFHLEEQSLENPHLARLMRAALADHVMCLRVALPRAREEAAASIRFRFEDIYLSNVLALAMRSGGVACARFLAEHEDLPIHQQLIKHAVRYANIDALRWLASISWLPRSSDVDMAFRDMPTFSSKILADTETWDDWDDPSHEARQRLDLRVAACLEILDERVLVPTLYIWAARKGQVESMRVLHARGVPMHCDLMLRAIQSGQVEAVRFAYEHNYAWPVTTTVDAIVGGSLECLQYAHEHGAAWHEGTTLSAAVQCRLDCLQYAYEHGAPWDPETTIEAARSGHLDCLRYAHEVGVPWHPDTIPTAALCDRIEILEYAHAVGETLSAETTLQAALGRSLQCLKFAHEHGAPWHDQTTLNATVRGSLECLKYAHEHGAPWHPKTMIEAARLGRLDCLRYAHEIGAPWHPDFLPEAAQAYRIRVSLRDVLEDCFFYAITHGCTNASAAAVAATRAGNLQLLQRLYEAAGSSVWSAEVCMYGASGRRRNHRQCLYYAREHGCAWDTRVWIQAAACGDLKLMAYALCHGCECDEAAVMRAAQRGNQVRAVQFLVLARDFGLITTPAA